MGNGLPNADDQIKGRKVSVDNMPGDDEKNSRAPVSAAASNNVRGRKGV